MRVSAWSPLAETNTDHITHYTDYSLHKAITIGVLQNQDSAVAHDVYNTDMRSM